MATTMSETLVFNTKKLDGQYLKLDQTTPQVTEGTFALNTSGSAGLNVLKAGDTMTGALKIEPDTDSPVALTVNDTDSNRVLTVDTVNNKVGVGMIAPTAKLHIAGSNDTQQLVVKANATQTANLQEWQNSSATVLASVDKSGVADAVGYEVGGVPGIDKTITVLDADGTTTHQLVFTKGILTACTTV